MLFFKNFIKKLLGFPIYVPKEKIIYTHYKGKLNNEKSILEGELANKCIFEHLQNEKSCLVGRIGSVEQECLYDFLQKKEWSKNTLKNMPHNAGFFPVSPKNLEKFSEIFLKCVQNVDILGVWFNEGEKYVCENYCQNADFVTLKSLEPYYHADAWSKVLAHKKVLVIHPFAKSIENQYQKRDFLFKDKNILPEFQLQTLQAVQSIAGNKPNFDSWFEALAYMQTEIAKRDFDIALIGAGAYSLPLASFIKNMDKKAIYLGGALQILFGIKGKRWEEKPFFQELFNEYWVKTLPDEIPKNAENVENGCYW